MRVGAHAARIGAFVAFTDALMVLRNGQQLIVFPVGKHENRRLFAVHFFFDDRLASGLAELLLSNISPKAFSASSQVSQTKAPLPAASPLALTTMARLVF